MKYFFAENWNRPSHNGNNRGRGFSGEIYERKTLWKKVSPSISSIQIVINDFSSLRQVQVETWDGKTKYKSTETEEELQDRLDKWEEFLVEEEKSKE